jgi:DNA modification methylase
MLSGSDKARMKDLFCKQSIIQGDCLEKMHEMQENSIDCILTDPPYGLSFMGKHWDKGIPGKEFWEEALRVCKPGATMLAFGGTRTYHRLACAIEDAGWQIRDSLMWLYGSGFPKSHNHFGFEGFGTALKPAYEPILLCMKPLDGTFAQNAEKWGVAGLNIDASRIGTDEITTQLRDRSAWHGNKYGSGGYEKPIGESEARVGRWPSNLLLDEEAAAMLDAQSGVSKASSGIKKPNTPTREIYGKYNPQPNLISGHNDSGGASRFFYCAKASSSERNKGCEGMQLKPHYTQANPQPDRDNRKQNMIANNHPTVKPTKLLEYLLKLIMPPSQEAILLDPFMGSGSTLVAAKNLGFNGIGIEIEEEYCEIARNRIE